MSYHKNILSTLNGLIESIDEVIDLLHLHFDSVRFIQFVSIQLRNNFIDISAILHAFPFPSSSFIALIDRLID